MDFCQHFVLEVSVLNTEDTTWSKEDEKSVKCHSQFIGID